MPFSEQNQSNKSNWYLSLISVLYLLILLGWTSSNFFQFIHAKTVLEVYHYFEKIYLLKCLVGCLIFKSFPGIRVKLFVWLCANRFWVVWYIWFQHSHKKRKDSLEGSMDRVLLAAELEFPKILVPRLPQHTSDVNIKCAGKSEWSKQQCSLHVTSFLEHWYISVLLFWY